ncbi:single-stranded DNA-binding protein WHY2, mitochondrial isoform X1 [Amborella trichopoda]|uniref:single-stranded DNA-binding protein WHY2, mitochondrial isoform X1 n=1 Tax=Amborella trichopoda TaxID=13333 RepID=UPI0005D3D479|nr:single-stranded DNA-binding protein WHY2, mitochondrial isoform X1 [Amborella trichopoda]|eukprot:XP_011621001.1 single-stranded DNA-binding protein WHY2, mitochondrial isoform X1 [Amborella trichopoda]
MMKFSHFSAIRRALTFKQLPAKAVCTDIPCLYHRTSRVGISTVSGDLGINGSLCKLSVPYCIFKGKAALKMDPIGPKFSKLNPDSMRIERRGCVLLTFFPAIGVRKYDWQKRQIFALSATEVGSVISLGPTDSCEFFHDPSLKKSDEGQVRKSLHIAPNSDNSGHFFNLQVTNAIQKTMDRLSVPVAKAELSVMQSAFSFILPHLMGWDRIANPMMRLAPENLPSPNIVRLPPSEVEWDR